MELNKFINNGLGVPIGAPIPKCATGSIVAALGLAAVGTAAAVSASADANDTNRELTRESQDFQEKMLLEQERYNSPQNQRAMLEEAGYSPYAFLQGAGSSVGLASSPSSIPTQTPDLSGFDKMASMLFNAEAMSADTELKQGQVINQGIINQMDAAKAQFASDNALWEMVANRNNANKLGYESESAFWNQKLDAYSFQDKVRNFALSNDLLKHNIDKVSMDTSLTTLNVMEAQERFNFLPQILNNEVKLQLAKIDTEYSMQHLNSARYQEAIAGVIKSAAETEGVKLNNQQIRDTSKFYVEQQKQNAAYAKWKALTERNNAVNSYNPLSGVRNEDNLRGKLWRGSKYAGEILNNANPLKGMFK